MCSVNSWKACLFIIHPFILTVSPLSSTWQVPHICRTTKELSPHLPFSSHVSSKMTQFPSHDFLLSPQAGPYLRRELQHGSASTPTFIHEAELLNQPQAQGEMGLMEIFLIWWKSTREIITGAKSLKEIVLVITLHHKLFPYLVIYFAPRFVGQRFRPTKSVGTPNHGVSRDAARVGGPISKLASSHTSPAFLCFWSLCRHRTCPLQGLLHAGWASLSMVISV